MHVCTSPCKQKNPARWALPGHKCKTTTRTLPRGHTARTICSLARARPPAPRITCCPVCVAGTVTHHTNARYLPWYKHVTVRIGYPGDGLASDVRTVNLDDESCRSYEYLDQPGAAREMDDLTVDGQDQLGAKHGRTLGLVIVETCFSNGKHTHPPTHIHTTHTQGGIVSKI
jgi:hypothetical protein